MSKLFETFFHQKAGVVRAQREAIEKILSTGPSTVAAIAQSTGFKEDLVLWNILGMMRWGTVDVAGEEGHEIKYALKEV